MPDFYAANYATQQVFHKHNLKTSKHRNKQTSQPTLELNANQSMLSQISSIQPPSSRENTSIQPLQNEVYSLGPPTNGEPKQAPSTQGGSSVTARPTIMVSQTSSNLKAFSTETLAESPLPKPNPAFSDSSAIDFMPSKFRTSTPAPGTHTTDPMRPPSAKSDIENGKLTSKSGTKLDVKSAEASIAKDAKFEKSSKLTTKKSNKVEKVASPPKFPETPPPPYSRLHKADDSSLSKAQLRNPKLKFPQSDSSYQKSNMSVQKVDSDTENPKHSDVKSDKLKSKPPKLSHPVTQSVEASTKRRGSLKSQRRPSIKGQKSNTDSTTVDKSERNTQDDRQTSKKGAVKLAWAKKRANPLVDDEDGGNRQAEQENIRMTKLIPDADLTRPNPGAEMTQVEVPLVDLQSQQEKYDESRPSSRFSNPETLSGGGALFQFSYLSSDTIYAQVGGGTGVSNYGGIGGDKPCGESITVTTGEVEKDGLIEVQMKDKEEELPQTLKTRQGKFMFNRPKSGKAGAVIMVGMDGSTVNTTKPLNTSDSDYPDSDSSKSKTRSRAQQKPYATDAYSGRRDSLLPDYDVSMRTGLDYTYNLCDDAAKIDALGTESTDARKGGNGDNPGDEDDLKMRKDKFAFQRPMSTVQCGNHTEGSKM